VKKFFSVLLMIISIFLLLIFFLGFIGSLIDFEFTGLIFAIIFFLIPGILLLITSIKMLDSSKRSRVDPYSMANTYGSGRPANPGMDYNRMPNGVPYGVPNPNQAGPSPQRTVNTGFDPLDARSVNDFVQQQIKQANTQGSRTVTTSYTYTSSTENGNPVNAFPGGASAVAGAAPKVPVSVECPGCGAVANVPPDRSVKCEFCGAVVPYKVATT
jgi:hypothetical protein